MPATQSISEFQRAARLKWPTALVTGDGGWAIYCERLNHVWLQTHYLWALDDLGRDHGTWQCADSHTLIELKPAPPRRAFRSPVDLERD